MNIENVFLKLLVVKSLRNSWLIIVTFDFIYFENYFSNTETHFVRSQFSLKLKVNLKIC